MINDHFYLSRDYSSHYYTVTLLYVTLSIVMV